MINVNNVRLQFGGRILFEDVIKYKNEMKQKQKKHIIDIMNFDDEIGLYDS